MIEGLASPPVNGREHGVPTAGPAQRGTGLRNFGITLSNIRVIRFRNRAFLRAEGPWRKRAYFVESLGIDSALRRQRIAHRYNAGQWLTCGGNDMSDGFGADIPGGPASRAVSGLQPAGRLAA